MQTEDAKRSIERLIGHRDTDATADLVVKLFEELPTDFQVPVAAKLEKIADGTE